ncbi:MAG: ABC transporter ATP-binding protein [Acidimicrobiales bacterium]
MTAAVSADEGTSLGPVLEGRGLYHIYREAELETIALRGTDVTLHAGSWASVTGPSGSGKSTLLNVLAGLMTPSAGQVLMDGRDIGRLDEAERAELRRTKLGVIMQRDNLHPLLSVVENVALPIELAGERARQRPAELIERVGLGKRSRNRPHQLSGGEAQRAAIAVALAGRPSILLADELTGELDEDTTQEILDLLAELCNESGLAILTVTHNPQVAARSQHRLVMSDGTLTEETDLAQ